VHDLDRLSDRAETIRLLVRTKERLPERLDRSLRPDLGRNVDHQLVVLSLVSEIEAARQASAFRPHAPAVEPLTRSRPELEELLVERRERVHLQWSEPGPDLIRAQVLYEQADGTEDPGIRRNHDARDAQLAGERGRVQRTRAPEGHEGEIVRVDPALNRHESEGSRHVGVDDLDHATRRLIRRESELVAQARNRLPGRARVQGHASVEQAARGDAAEQQVGIGDRRLRTTAAIAGRSRVRTGAPRSYLQSASRVT